MPANIAHMIIVHKAFELLRTKGFDDLAAGRDFEESPKEQFRNVVTGADLSCPLAQNILGKARDALTKADDGRKYAPLFEAA